MSTFVLIGFDVYPRVLDPAETFGSKSISTIGDVSIFESGLEVSEVPP